MDFLAEIAETPMVGAAPHNTGRFPSTPWAIMDFIYGMFVGGFGPLLIKSRSGDCFSKLAAFGIGIAGIGKYWDYLFGAGAKGIIIFVSTFGFEAFGIFNLTATCIKQYNFSTENPWRAVFESAGHLDPYAIGSEARRQAAKKRNLKKTNIWPNQKVALATKEAAEEEFEPISDLGEPVQSAADAAAGAADDGNYGLDNFASAEEVDRLAK